MNEWKQSVLEYLQSLNFHFVLVRPEVVVCSRIWAGDALSSSEHFSESFFPH